MIVSRRSTLIGGVGGGALLLFALALYVVAFSVADLRFARCHGSFAVDAVDAYCRGPGQLAWAAIGLGSVAILAMGAAGVIALAAARRPDPVDRASGGSMSAAPSQAVRPGDA